MSEHEKKGTAVISSVEKFFKQFPALPVGFREFLVTIAPWLALIFGIIGITGVVFGGFRIYWTPLGSVISLVGIVTSILLLMAYPKLVKKQAKGWEYVFWAMVVSAISAVVAIIYSFNLFPALVIAAGLYLLFQIKQYYK
ncbi:MAG TPA: hypothetical protein VLF20_05160 [Patescibacteria group bacterium]|nr:hypothetical protein [Patescibacteria group bacterium]